MNDLESGNKGRGIKIFEKLGFTQQDQKGAYSPERVSNTSRLQRYLEQGIVEVGSLSRLLQNVGLDECEKGKEMERDEVVNNTRKLLQPHEGLLRERIATLPLYFER